MIPDKIYVPRHNIEAGNIQELDEFIVEGSIEYIRKDLFLKWAKQKQYESTTIVADNFWQEVIDKINSL